MPTDFEFAPLKERFERLEDHLRIARAMFTEERATVAGDHHFSVTEAYNNPKPLRGDIPIVVGGSGERKTLRMVAQYADGCNLFGDTTRAQHLLGVLRGPLRRRVGRDPAEITKTSMMTIAIAENRGRRQGQARCDARGRRSPSSGSRIQQAGTPDQILERAHAFGDVGIEGVTFTMPDVHDLEAVTLAGEDAGAGVRLSRSDAAGLGDAAHEVSEPGGAVGNVEADVVACCGETPACAPGCARRAAARQPRVRELGEEPRSAQPRVVGGQGPRSTPWACSRSARRA